MLPEEEVCSCIRPGILITACWGNLAGYSNSICEAATSAGLLLHLLSGRGDVGKCGCSRHYLQTGECFSARPCLSSVDPAHPLLA